MSAGLSVFRLRHQARRFANDGRGSALIEFAVILPTMFALAFGASELCNAFAIDRKLTIVARSVSDIAAQCSAISDEDVQSILGAGKVLLQPYTTDSLKIRVSAVKIDAAKNATIVWSDASSGPVRAKDQAVTIPAGLAIPNTQLIWGEVAYDYTPNSPFGAIKSVWPFEYEDNQFFAKPRESSGTVVRSPTATCIIKPTGP